MASVKMWCVLLLTATAANIAAGVSRIAGGYEMPIEELPTAVQVESLIGIFWQSSCGGHIVTNIYVISSAQCFSGLIVPPFRRIRAGATERNVGGVVLGVSRVFNHPTFGETRGSFDGDIAIVRLNDYLEYGPGIQRGPIVAENFVMPPNIQVIIAGWGRTQNDEARSDVLRIGQVTTTDSATCASAYENTDNSFCAISDSSDACAGDIGGPVYLDSILVGVISGNPSCDFETPRIYTDVASFTSWITETIDDNP